MRHPDKRVGRLCGCGRAHLLVLKSFPLAVQEAFQKRGEERERRQSQHRFTREQLEAVRGREQVDFPPRRPLRRLHPQGRSRAS